LFDFLQSEKRIKSPETIEELPKQKYDFYFYPFANKAEYEKNPKMLER
jgi:hypothetical protein